MLASSKLRPAYFPFLNVNINYEQIRICKVGFFSCSVQGSL
jgi:hypothetical protein